MSDTDAPPDAVALAVVGLAVDLGRRSVLADLDLELHAGERIAVVGPNGSGKSTLLRACAGILAATRGEVKLDGRPLGTYRRRALARLLAFMPQQSDLRFPMSGLEAVLLGRSPHQRGLGLAAPGDLEAARGALDRLEIGHLADRAVTSVSGGERQRLMLARVLVQQTPVLLLDEPTSAQDPYGVLLMRQVVAEEATRGRALLVAVHDLNLALRAFDRVLVLARGRALALASPGQVVAQKALDEAFGIALRAIDDGDEVWVVAERRGVERRPTEAS